MLSRLAPSPTGAQHLGNARTFLVAFWAARAAGHRLLLRIEDIDSPRVKPWATQQAIDDLRWLGIQWDGPPIVQTENVQRYADVLDRLRCDDLIYPCSCTRRDIESAASAPHDEAAIGGEGPVYAGTCSAWRCGEAVPDENSVCWRYRVQPGTMTLVDRVAGSVKCDPAVVLGDFPVTRKGGDAAYQLAVVVDDIDAGVTEVVRGDDLVSSTFRQLQLYRSLGATPPRYAHLPLVVGVDGRRLAKRHGDTRLSTYREQGVAPERIVAWAAKSTGLVTQIEGTLAQMHAAMIESFDWLRINRQRVVVDTDFDKR